LTVLYIDTSAAAKLVLEERDSAALRQWLEPHQGELCSSDLLRTELQRAVRRAAPDRLVQATAVLEAFLLMQMPTATYETASTLEPSSLRSLDALHLASALGLGDDLEGIVTYDERMTEAAHANGVATFSPR
jgi:predicted nucleic acid-binding protein